MSLIEYIVEGEHHTMKTRTPNTGVLVIHVSNSTALPFPMLRGRAISQRLLLESLKRLIAILFALRAGVDYRMYQPQLVGTPIARGLYLVEQIIQFQGQCLPIHIVCK